MSHPLAQSHRSQRGSAGWSRDREWQRPRHRLLFELTRVEPERPSILAHGPLHLVVKSCARRLDLEGQCDLGALCGCQVLGHLGEDGAEVAYGTHGIELLLAVVARLRGLRGG